MLDPFIRWLAAKDLVEVLEIEVQCFDRPWNMTEFRRALRERTVLGFVLEQKEGPVLGYAIFELQRYRLHLLNFAICPVYQRQRLGTYLMDKVKTKLKTKAHGGLERHKITVEVSEYNDSAHLFLREQNFKAVSVLRDFCDDESDAYLFMYRHAKTTRRASWKPKLVTPEQLSREGSNERE